EPPARDGAGTGPADRRGPLPPGRRPPPRSRTPAGTDGRSSRPADLEGPGCSAEDSPSHTRKARTRLRRGPHITALWLDPSCLRSRNIVQDRHRVDRPHHITLLPSGFGGAPLAKTHLAHLGGAVSATADRRS